MRPPPSLGLDLTPLTTRVLGGLVGLFVLQLLAENWLGLPVLSALAWWPAATGLFRPWQPITSVLINGPAPASALFDWLVVLFFLPSAERALGRRGLVRLALFVVGLGAVVGVALDLVGVLAGRAPFLGLNPLLTALIVVFGLTRPDAIILLFFVLPVRAAWIAWGTGLFALLSFLSARDLGSLLWLVGWVGAWLYLRSGGFPRVGRRRRRPPRPRFDVIEGGRPWWDDGTIH